MTDQPKRNAARAERDAAKRNVAKTATEKIIAASGAELLTRIAELESANASGSAGFEALRAEWESLKTERDALRAERDALSEALERNCVQYVKKQQALIAERDALRADVARLRAALEGIEEYGKLCNPCTATDCARPIYRAS
jgi:seryl-tRNA synthetase